MQAPTFKSIIEQQYKWYKRELYDMEAAPFTLHVHNAIRRGDGDPAILVFDMDARPRALR